MRNQIIIVDDDKEKYEKFLALIRENGFDYTVCTSVEETLAELDLWKEKRYVGMILDGKFPLETGEEGNGKAGFMILEKMEERQIKLPVLVNSTIISNKWEQYENTKGQLATAWTTEMKEYVLLEFLNSTIA